MVDPPFPPPKPNLPFLVTSLAGQNSNSVMTPEGNCSKPNGKANVSEKSRSEGMKQNKFLIVTLKLYMLTSRQIRLSRFFARENGIKKAEEIILVDKHGVKWPSYLASTNQQDFYMTKCWISFCAANGLKIGETFTLEFVRGKDTTPMFKFCSKTKVKIEQQEEEGQVENEARVPKRARVSAEGEPSCPTRASNKSRVDSRNLQTKQPLQPCPISDLVTKVKLSIVDALNGVRRFRSELDIMEKNLEALLHEIDASGEKVLEMEKDPQVPSYLNGR